MHHSLRQHSDLGAKSLNKICLKFVQKVLKWPLQYVNFQKLSGGHAPVPPRAFFNLNMLQNDFTEKLPLKIHRNWVPLPEKFLNSPQT